MEVYDFIRHKNKTGRTMLLTTREGAKTPETQALIKAITEREGAAPDLYTLNKKGDPIPLYIPEDDKE